MPQSLMLTRADAGAGTVQYSPPPAALPQERRSDERTWTLYRIARIAAGELSGLCRVQNISNGGMMLMTSLELERGTIITANLSDTVSLTGTVVWSNGVRMGIRLERPIDAATVLRRLADERRQGAQRAPRLPVDAMALATTEAGMRPVRVLNISQHGMKVAHEGGLQPGIRVKIVLESGLERRGTVRWTDGSAAGLQLLQPISHRELECAAKV